MDPYDFAAPRLYVPADLHAGAALTLDEPQHNYLRNVLRLKEGGGVLVFNGRHGEWRARLAGEGRAGKPGGGRAGMPGERPTGKAVNRVARQSATLVAVEQVRAQTPPGNLDLLFAPLKHARLDYMVQKAVEMGASALRPVLTARTQPVRFNEERMAANAIEAAEQCGILALPSLHAPVPLDAVLAGWDATRALVFCDEQAESASSWPVARHLAQLARDTPCAVLIGPEGGFDPAERAALLALPQVVRLSLGPRILRADTAVVAALALVQATIGDWSVLRSAEAADG